MDITKVICNLCETKYDEDEYNQIFTCSKCNTEDYLMEIGD